MAYIYNFPNSTTGMDSLLVETASVNHSFIPLLLFALFLFTFFGGTTLQRRRTGYSDSSQWALLSMIFILIISLGLSLVKGLISQTTLVIVVVLTLLSGIWFFFDRRSGED